MTSLIAKLQTKLLSLSLCRLISSLALLKDRPLIEPIKHEYHFPNSSLDPFHVFSVYSRTVPCTIENTEILHSHLLKTALFECNMFLSNFLLDWYCKSGDMFNAAKLFDRIPQPNAISWNIMISGYNNTLKFEDSLRTFCRLRILGVEANEITYGSVLSSCANLQACVFSEQLYSLAIKNGFYSNGYLRTGIMDVFSKSGNFDCALRVFNDVSCGNVVCWNSVISGAVRNRENWVALELFGQMCRRFLVPNSFTFSSILTACAALGEIETGKGVQAWVIKCCVKDVFVGTAIVDLYAKCGDIVEAVQEFSRMAVRNVVSWTAIIAGFVKNDDSISALKIFKDMRKMGGEINNFTATTVVTSCAKPGMTNEAIQIHSWILKAGFCLDPVVEATVINMYSKIGAIDLSEAVFKERTDIKNPGPWAVMISSFAQNYHPQRAIKLFWTMIKEGLKPDQACYSSVFSVIDSLRLGRQLHCYTLKTGFVFDLSIGSSLFTMYSKCGTIKDSYKVFEEIPTRDNVSLASMIAGFAEHGLADQAFGLFRDLLSEETRPDQMSLAAILTACSGLCSLRSGKEIHGYIFRAGISREPLVGSALVTMYLKCRALKFSKVVFDMLPEKDQISCSALVSGYAQNGLLEEALSLLHEISISNFAIDSFMIASILGAVAILNRLGVGIQLHGYVTKMGLDSDVSVGSSLVTMYSKCGSIKDSSKAFDRIDEPDLIGWTAMIAGYAQHGKGEEALRMYEHMRKEGIRPDPVTFVEVLSACSRANLVEDGYFHFDNMTREFGIQPNSRHYACMVDLIGRSGGLKEAEKFIESMPIEPDALVWGTLLAACKLHGDVDLGKVAAKKAMDLEPYDAGAYVALSNIFADVRQWEGVLEVRRLMKGTGVRKEFGWSSM